MNKAANMAPLFKIPELVSIIAQYMRPPSTSGSKPLNNLHSFLLVSQTCFHQAVRELYRDPGGVAETKRLLNTLQLVTGPLNPRSRMYQRAIQVLHIQVPGPIVNVVQSMFSVGGRLKALVLWRVPCRVSRSRDYDDNFVAQVILGLVNSVMPEKLHLANDIVGRVWTSTLGLIRVTRLSIPWLRVLEFNADVYLTLMDDALIHYLVNTVRAMPHLKVVWIGAYISSQRVRLPSLDLVHFNYMWNALVQLPLARFEVHDSGRETALGCYSKLPLDRPDPAGANWRHVKLQNFHPSDALRFLATCGESAVVEVVHVELARATRWSDNMNIVAPLLCFNMTIGEQLRELRLHASTFGASAAGIGKLGARVPNLHTFVLTSAHDYVFNLPARAFVYNADIEQFARGVPMLRVFRLRVSFTVLSHESLVALGTHCRRLEELELNTTALSQNKHGAPARTTNNIDDLVLHECTHKLADLSLNRMLQKSQDLEELCRLGEILDTPLFPHVHTLHGARLGSHVGLHRFTKKHFPAVK